MPPPDKKRKRLLEEDLLESKRSRDGGRTRSPIARSSRKCSSFKKILLRDQDNEPYISFCHNFHNDDAGGSVREEEEGSEVIDLGHEARKEEDRSGPAVR